MVSTGSTNGALPKTWRPFGVRMAGWIFGLALVIVLAGAWISFPQAVKDGFSIWQRITTVLLFGGFLAAEYGLMRCRATASATGLTVVNGYRVHVFAWTQIVSIKLPVGAPWAVLDLDDGTTCSVMALQSADGLRAKRGVEQIRSLLG
jgi:Bacterial PH domain